MEINGILLKKGLRCPGSSIVSGRLRNAKLRLSLHAGQGVFQCPVCGGERSSEFVRGTLRYLQCRACRH